MLPKQCGVCQPKIQFDVETGAIFLNQICRFVPGNHMALTWHLLYLLIATVLLQL